MLHSLPHGESFGENLQGLFVGDPRVLRMNSGQCDTGGILE